MKPTASLSTLVVCFLFLGYCQELSQRMLPSYLCRQLGCTQGCQVTDAGRTFCTCMTGFQIQDDNVSCQDIDECMQLSRVCQHGCNNTVGSFICTCPPGYSLRNDGRTCRKFTDYSETPCGRGSNSNNPCSSTKGHVSGRFPSEAVLLQSKPNIRGVVYSYLKTRRPERPCTSPPCLNEKESVGHKSKSYKHNDGMRKQGGHVTIDNPSAGNNEKTVTTESTVTEGINEDYDNEDEIPETVGGLPPCLSGDCDLGNIHEILTDCTGSGCPPRNNDWYETFLGIPMPDHKHFERKWKNSPARKKKTRTQIEKIGEKHTFYKQETAFYERQADQAVNTRTKGRKVLHAKTTIKDEKMDKNHFNQENSKRNFPTDEALKDEPNCRDDLCIELNGNDQIIDTSYPEINQMNRKDFDCPPGYEKGIRGKVTFCKPKEFLSEPKEEAGRCGDGKQLVRINGREFCVPVKPKPFHNTLCPKGQVPFPGDNGIQCADAKHDDIVVCQDGQIAMETLFGTICVHPHDEQGQIPALGKSCDSDEKVDPKAMCAPGTVPEIKNGRLACGPETGCQPGEVAVQTESGTVCRTVTSPPVVATPSATEQPCPYGLTPLQTSVGRICQYLPPNRKLYDTEECPEGQEIKKSDGTPECLSNHQRDYLECPEGQTLIRTEKGDICGYEMTKQKRCPTGIFDKYGDCVLSKVVKCPEGQIRLEGQGGFKCAPNLNSCPYGFITVDGVCHDLNINYLCPVGQELVETDDGFDCIYRQKRYPGHGTKMSDCGREQILSQAMRSFYCETHEVSSSEVILCKPGEVFVKVGGGYACITELEASLRCTETEVLIRLPDGFTCIPMKGSSSKKHHLPRCGRSEVQFTDENGFRVCLSLERATAACGKGYRAVKSGQEFLCRKEKLDLHCPTEFVLSLHEETPFCVAEIDMDCIPLGGQMTPTCIEKLSKRPLPPCENGYQIEKKAGGFECSLQSTYTDDCGRDGCNKKDCNSQDDAVVRACDIDPQLLLAGCNPECANGGTCNNGTCICPVGITGKACNEDENECLTSENICEYQCENTFGSYQCTCPPGMSLHTDRRTCKADQCSPDCLNGGSCINGRCRCPRGLKGEFCQTDINECELYGNRLCQHTCRNTYGAYSCICPHGTRLNADGRTCTNTTCIHKCRNGGECENNRCICPEGFYGIVCQLDVNECYKFQPCSHTCVNLRGSYMCTCPQDYRLLPDGHTCEQTIVE